MRLARACHRPIQGVGLLKYIVQGFGWHVGAHAAKEGLEALERQRLHAETPRPLSRREMRRREKEAAKEAARVRCERAKAAARIEAQIEAQLQALKKKADR